MLVILRHPYRELIGWCHDRWRPLLAAVAAATGLGLLIAYRRPVWAMVRLLGDREAVIAYLAQFGPAAPALLSAIIVLQVIVAMLPGHALLFAAGYVYGFPRGLGLNLISVVGASQAAFLIARWAGRPVVERLTPVETLNRLHALAQRKGVLFFMLAFMLPIFPADVLNYAAGLTGLSPRRFFVANLVGRLPMIVISTAVGAYAFQISASTWLIILPVALALFLCWRRLAARP